MSTTTDISNIKTMISSGRLDDAIMELLQKAKSEKNTHLERFGIHFSGQLSDLSRSVINGTLSADEMNRTKNKIQKSLLDVLGHYENNTLNRLAESGAYGLLPIPSPWVKWQKIIVGIFILGVASFMLYEAYVAFFPKGIADESKCWIKTKPFFAELVNEPRFSPDVATIASLPGNKKYQVEDTKLEGFGSIKHKYYKIREGSTVGWIRHNDVKIASPLCD